MNESTSTTQSATRARPARRLLAALAAMVAISAILATPAPAWAHSHLRSARPAAGAKLDAVPRALSLTFSEPPELAVSSLRLVYIGADSTPVALGTLASAADPHTITASVTGPMAPGRYVVIWQVAGEDGHVVRGSYSFAIAEGAAGIQSVASEESVTAVAQRADSSARADSAASNLPRNFDAASPAYVVIRWAQFAGLLILIGAVAFRWWIIPRIGGRVTEALREELAAGAAGTGLAGAWLLALTALLRLVAQSLSLHGAVRMVDAAPLGSMIADTTWGHAWLFEVVWLVVILFAFRQAGRHPASFAAWGVAGVAAICLAAVPALSGHAIATPQMPGVAVGADILHLLAGGSWMGGLAVMVVAGLPVATRGGTDGRNDALAAMVNAFSPLALTAAGVLVLTGFIAARFHLGTIDALLHSSYGQTLLVKLAVILVLIPVATYNWRRVRPSLAGDPEGAQRLTTSGRVELAIALGVLLVTAVLVALPTPIY